MRNSLILLKTKPHSDAACPSLEEIRATLLGHGPTAHTDFLADHIRICQACAALIEAEQVSGPLLSALREAPLPTPPTSHELADLSARLSDLFTDRPRPDGKAVTNPPVPDQIGAYRIKGQLGIGGMGIVYRAEDTALGRDVALKVLRPGVDHDPRYRARFTQEARALAALHHDNVVTVYHVGEVDGADGRLMPFFAMELLTGCSLQDWMAKNQHPTVELVTRIGRQAASGLASAHARGLLHRDVKPANLWLEASEGWDTVRGSQTITRVKLIDFGLARATDADSQVDGRAGTPGYMPPEQVSGEPLTPRTDIFALGCVLYELCTGKRPFSDASVNGPPSRVAQLAPNVPTRLASLIERMVSLDPAGRPASAADVESELAAVAAEVERNPKHRRLVRWGVAVVTGVVIAFTWYRAGPGDPIAQPTHTDSGPSQSTVRARFPADAAEEEWCREFATRPPKEQFTMMTAKFAELNPGFTATQASGWVEPELVLRFMVRSNVVRDIRPIRALTTLQSVGVMGIPPGGVFSDLSPLEGLPLRYAIFHNQPALNDLSPLRNCPLFHLDVRRTGITSLADVNGECLEELSFSGTKVSDLSPVRRMRRLLELECDGCPVASFEPLVDSNVKVLQADVRTTADLLVLRRVPHLEKVNGVQAAEFFKNFVSEK